MACEHIISMHQFVKEIYVVLLNADASRANTSAELKITMALFFFSPGPAMPREFACAIALTRSATQATWLPALGASETGAASLARAAQALDEKTSATESLTCLATLKTGLDGCLEKSLISSDGISSLISLIAMAAHLVDKLKRLSEADLLTSSLGGSTKAFQSATDCRVNTDNGWFACPRADLSSIDVGCVVLLFSLS